MAEDKVENMESTEHLTEDIALGDTEEPHGTQAPSASSLSSAKLCRLPITKIKNIIKMDPDVQLARGEAVFLITKLTEMFIDSMAKEAYAYTARAKRKIVSKNDLDAAIENIDCLCFLEGALDF